MLIISALFQSADARASSCGRTLAGLFRRVRAAVATSHAHSRILLFHSFISARSSDLPAGLVSLSPRNAMPTGSNCHSPQAIPLLARPRASLLISLGGAMKSSFIRLFQRLRRSVSLFAIIITLGSSLITSAQQTITSATLTGRVEDANGAALAGATITATNLDKN